MRTKVLPYLPDVNDESYIDWRGLSVWEIKTYVALCGAGKKRIATVCFLYGNGKWARGVAICDPHDRYSETIGSDVSYEYAMWAMARRDSGRMIHNPVARYLMRSIRRERQLRKLERDNGEVVKFINLGGIDIFDDTVTYFDMHSYYKPVLSEKEFVIYGINDPILSLIRNF